MVINLLHREDARLTQNTETTPFQVTTQKHYKRAP